MWADRLAIFIVFLTRLFLPSLALDSLSSTVADFILPTVHPKLNKRLQRPSLRSPHRKTIGYHLCSLQEEPMLSSHPRLSPNPYTVALEKRHPTRNSSFESSPNLSKLPFAPKMPQSSQFVVSSNPDVLRSKLRNVIENWGSLPNSNLSRLAHYSDDHELELILADPRSIAVESPDSTPKKKHPNRKLDAVIAPPAEDTTSPNLNSDTAVDQPKLSNQKVTSISEDRSFFQTDDRQQVPIVELNSSARGNNAARSMVVPIDAQEEKKKEIDVPDFLSKSLEELRIESLELSRSIEQAKSGLVGEELTMMSQWIKSRIQSFNSRFLSQDAIGLTLLGKAPTAEIVVMYNSTVSNNPRLKSDTFVYLEQVNLGTMNLEMHIPVATNTLNHLLSWTTVYALNTFNIHSLTPFQAAMLPLLVRPLVNYADQVINKEKMPNLIVGVSDEVGSGKTWSYLMGAVDYIVRGFHFKTDAAKSLSRSDLRPGPKAVIVLPTKDAVIRMRKLIGDICEALSQQRHSNGNNNFGVRSSPLVVTYLAIISRIQNAQLLKYINSHDIVIATPALLRELVDRNQLSLAHVRFFVVDEVPHSTVDPSVDPNYALDVAKLVSRLPPVTKYHNIKLLLLAREFNESTQYLVTKVAESYKISVPSNGLHGGRISCCQGFIKLETVRQKAEFVPPVVLQKLCDRIPCYVDAEVQQQFILYDDSDRKLNTLVDLIEKPSHADHIGFVVLTRDKSCANQLSIAIQTLTKRKVFLSRCEHLANITGDIRLEVQQNLSKNDFRPVVIIMEMPDNPAELFNVNFNKICYDLSWHVVNYNCPKSYDDFVARSLCVVGPKCFAIGDNHLRLSLRRDIAHQLKPVTVHTFFREMEYSLILDYNRRLSTHK